MASQFEKRKAKVKPEVVETTVETVLTPAEVTDLVVGTQEELFTHMAYDIYLAEDNRTYKVITINYNPVTKAARVVEEKEIGRNIGLSYDYQKKALTSLKGR
jgi:hypothetical protein